MKLNGWSRGNLRSLFNKNKQSKLWGGIAILASIISIYGLVYLTGGIKYVFAHSMYIPILLAAFIFRAPGGAVAGLIGGLLLGPLMPLDTHTGEMQGTINWLYRTGFFTLIGALSGQIIQIAWEREQKISWLLYHDPKTNLPNVSFLEQFIEKDLAQEFSNQWFLLSMISIENYYEIANTLGVSFVEKLIREIGERLDQSDLGIIRIFLVRTQILGIVLNSLQDPELVLVAITKLLDETFWVEDIPTYADTIVGTAAWPQHARDAADLIQKGIYAVDLAREKGLRNLVYNPNGDRLSKENLKLLGTIPAALRRDEFELWYQPIIRSEDGRVTKVEALIRWRHPVKGLLLPGKFIPLVEQTGLIHNLTDWVLIKSIRQLKRWSEDGYDIHLAINISARYLTNPSFYTRLVELTDRYHIAPQKIDLEITETALIFGIDTVVAHLEKLREYGFIITMDDYGSGYTSLANLSLLPIQGIKIDRLLISKLQSDEVSSEIVKAIIALGKKIQIKIVAEGVEDEVSQEQLVKWGCDYLQGYHICRPLPVDEITAYFTDRKNSIAVDVMDPAEVCQT